LRSKKEASFVLPKEAGFVHRFVRSSRDPSLRLKSGFVRDDAIFTLLRNPGAPRRHDLLRL